MRAAMIGTAMTVMLAGAGCAMEDGGDDVLGEAHQEVGSFGIWGWGCGGASPCSLDLGPIAGQTCFLAGVWGNLQHAGTYSQAEVVQSGGHWGLQIVPNSHPLGATAVCIPGTTTATGRWHSGQAEQLLVTGATQRCFLSGVRNTNGFTASSDYVRVRKVGSSWYLGGNQPGKDAWAYATCVNVPTDGPDVALVVGDGGSLLQRPLHSNNPGGWACGMTHIGGHFTANDYNDGAWISYNNGISEWELNGVNGKQVVADCVK